MVLFESLPVIITLWIFFAFIMINIYKKRDNENRDLWKAIDELALAVLILVFTVIYSFLLIEFGTGYQGVFNSDLTYELAFLGNLFIVGTTFCIFLWAITAKIRYNRNPNYRGYSNYEEWLEIFKEEFPKRSPLKRKITHMLPIIVVFTSYILCFTMQDWLGATWKSYAMMFIIIIGIEFAIFFMIGDTVRLFDFSWCPPNAAKLYLGAMSPKEDYTYTSTAAMIFGFAPFLFFDFTVFTIILVITCLSDAMAYIIGSTYGVPKEHFFPKDSQKTVEGYLGGVVFTFVSVMIGSIFSNWSLELKLSVSVLMAITFFLIDFSNSKLQDNYLNPLICGLVLIIYLSILNVPIF